MMGGWTMGWMWIWPVFIVVGVLIIGYAAVRLAQGRQVTGRPESHAGSAARRILDERYARGEIDHEEYRRRSDELP